VDLFGAIETDPDAFVIEASRSEFLAGQSVEIEFAARDRGKYLCHGNLDEADFIDREFVAGVAHAFSPLALMVSL
jgi:hypothetical protein